MKQARFWAGWSIAVWLVCVGVAHTADSAGRSDTVSFTDGLRVAIWDDPLPTPADPYGLEERAFWEAAYAATQDELCGVRFDGETAHYTLETFSNPAAATDAGFHITHLGPCGTCSTLQDLAVYLDRPDFTRPARRCAAFRSKPGGVRACFRRLGLSEGCAQIWAQNAENTANECRKVCVKAWVQREPANDKNGFLNACLECDERRSGPVFKAVAGRTRRRSGIPTDIKREVGEIAPLSHSYADHLMSLAHPPNRQPRDGKKRRNKARGSTREDDVE